MVAIWRAMPQLRRDAWKHLAKQVLSGFFPRALTKPPLQEFANDIGHRLFGCTWKDLIPASRNLIPHISELELVHGAEQNFSCISPCRCFVQNFAKSLNDCGSDKTSVAVCSL